MSAATQSAPVTNGVSSSPSKVAYDHSEALKKIASVPLVSDSLSFAHSTIQSHSLLATTYGYGENIFNSSLKAAEPITNRLHPQLAYVDSLAFKSLNFAESKWSYPFHANTKELIDVAKLPADHARDFVQTYAAAIQKAYGERVYTPAKSAYESHVVPVYDTASTKFDEIKSQNAYLQRATDIVKDLQANLAKTLETISSRSKQEGDQATEKAQGLSNAIFAELERVRSFAQSLPAESRKRVGPVIETFTETYERLAKEARNPEVPASTRFLNVIKFVREQSLPALQKAIINPPSETTQKAEAKVGATVGN
ncbi:lipid droplet-associated perilipin protein [Pseudozyma hubeiensis SY62]|uniref:Lipid droplet-associated perilipin protein n=1 Tax=Pseudozyma hubeiensis (strain SY62) TaxID=1305764 RepID=R9PJ50_PSEHS|nr:lipid droplet-associated perilipin protein [Pseudozyma hubeiensis SY62]GAC98150.1 lipid droplet-associated perilipin protein [Pseudozyma hubeiensis SY62]